MAGLQGTDVMLLTSAPCAETLTLQSNCKTGATEQPAHWFMTGEAISKCSIDPYFSISKQNPSREWWDPCPDKVCLHSFNLDKQSILVYNGFSVHISIPNDLYKKQVSLPWAQVRHRTCIEVKVSRPNTWWPLAGGIDTSSSYVVQVNHISKREQIYTAINDNWYELVSPAQNGYITIDFCQDILAPRRNFPD